mgnify:CR=1 FL=1
MLSLCHLDQGLSAGCGGRSRLDEPNLIHQGQIIVLAGKESKPEVAIEHHLQPHVPTCNAC